MGISRFCLLAPLSVGGVAVGAQCGERSTAAAAWDHLHPDLLQVGQGTSSVLVLSQVKSLGRSRHPSQVCSGPVCPLLGSHESLQASLPELSLPHFLHSHISWPSRDCLTILHAGHSDHLDILNHGVLWARQGLESLHCSARLTPAVPMADPDPGPFLSFPAPWVTWP